MKFLDLFVKKGSEVKDEPTAKVPAQKADTTKTLAKSDTQSPFASDPSSNPLTPPKSETKRDEEVVFTLADFLGRIPDTYLVSGTLDRNIEFRFEVTELTTLVMRGQTTMPIAELYRRAPQIFQKAPDASDPTEVRFPWQRLLEIAKNSDDAAAKKNGDSAAEQDSLVEKMRIRKRNIVVSQPLANPAGKQNLAALKQTFGAAPDAQTAAPAAAPSPAPAAAPATQPVPPTKPAQSARPSWLAPEKDKPAAPQPQRPPSMPVSPFAASEKTPTPAPQVPPPAKAAIVPPPAPITKPAPALSQTTPDNVPSGLTVLPASTAEPTHVSKPNPWLPPANAEPLKVAAPAQPPSPAPSNQQYIEQLAHLRAELEIQKSQSFTEIEELRREIAARTAEHTKLKQQLAQASEAAAREVAAREAIEKRYAGTDASLAEERQRLDAARAEIEQKIQTLTAERDTVLTERNSLAEQISVLNGRLSAATADSTRTDRRQAEELQRRISALETAQREAVQELSKEREAKIKAERSLSAAERARSEASNMVDQIRAETRRELDTVKSQRDSQLARLQTESQEKLTALQASTQKLSTELTIVSERAGELEQKVATLTAERDKLTSERDTVSTGGSAWEGRALASLEADIENYRQRIKIIIAERDAAQRERDTLQAKAATGGGDSEEFESLRRDRDQLASRVMSLDGELRDLREKGGDHPLIKGLISTALASSNQATDSLRSQFDDSQKEIATLHTELQAARSEIANGSELVLKLRSELANLQGERERLTAAGATSENLRKELERAQRELENARTSSNSTITGLRADLKKINFERDSAREEVARLKLSLETSQAEKDQISRSLDSEQGAVRQQGETIATLKAQVEDLGKTIAALTGERDELTQTREQLTSELATTRENNRTQVAGLFTDIETLRKAQTDAEAAHNAQLTDAQKLIAELRETLDHTRNAAAAEKTSTLQAHENALKTVHDELNATREDRDRTTAERDAARNSLQSTTTELGEVQARLNKEIEDLRTVVATLERKATEERLAAVSGLETEVSMLREQLTATTGERNKAQEDNTQLLKRSGELAASEAELREIRTRLESQLAMASTERDDFKATVSLLEAKLQEAGTSIQSREADIARIQREHSETVALVHAEREKGIAAANADKLKSLQLLMKDKEELTAAVQAERDRAKILLAEQENKLRIEMAGIVADRDDARNDTTAVAQRLANVTMETERRIAELESAVSQLTTERAQLTAEFDAAKEAHAAQAAVFAREFKSVIKQRDDSLAAADDAKKLWVEKNSDLDKERDALRREHEEMKQRVERELSRMRRERDSLVEQRDDLRGRLARLAGDQQRILEDLGTGGAKRPFASPVDVMPPEPRMEPDDNVIDIQAAEVIRPTEDSAVRPPQVRPMNVPPPQVRVL